VQAALAWRDFMVSEYSDAGAAQWLADRGIALLRGTGRLAGAGVVEVDGVRHTTEHVVLANGSDPIAPSVAGLRELKGIWGTREATGMTAVPERLIVLGGGPAGLEIAQVVRRFGGEVVLVEGATRALAREPAPLGEALGDALRRDGIELVLGAHATAARREGDDFVLELADGRELRGDRLLVATGRRPRVDGIGLETVGIAPDARGIRVDARMSAGERLWAIGDVTGLWQLTHVGEYQGEIMASNILGEPREANYEAVPRVTYTDPQAAAVGATDAPFTATARLSGVAKTATYTHAYAESNGFLTLLSDGERVTGAYGLGPEAAEWMQQATLAIRARVPLAVLRDTIQPFPSFSEIHAVPADVSVPSQVDATLHAIGDQWGPIEVLVNDAAVVWPLGPSVELDLVAWETALAINVTAVARLTFAVLPAMLERRWGRIVNVSSGVVANPAGMLRASPDLPRSPIKETVCATSSAERARTATRAPASARPREMARPMPRPPPVTRATRPSNASFIASMIGLVAESIVFLLTRWERRRPSLGRCGKSPGRRGH
jgi:pyruvate/2-oxoglutarate dehydrogenase complex dihydrolipoamide dehydrogenase (E3) component